MQKNVSLTAEERFLWDCARYWRTPEQVPIPDGLAWDRVIELTQSNRMQTLLHQVLTGLGALTLLPPAGRETLEEDVLRLHATLKCLVRRCGNICIGRGAPA